jgi:hypothetical protein
VTDANLAAVNAAVAASTNTAFTTAELQAIVAAVALVKFNHWDGITETAPTIADHYGPAGVTGVTDANLAAVNAAVAASTNTAFTTAELQAIVAAVALVKFNSHWEGNTEPAPTIADHYGPAGVTGVTDANLAAVNAAIGALIAASTNSAFTTADIQAIVVAVAALSSPSACVCKNFAVHARTTITFDGVTTTVQSGDVGVSPGTAITGTPQLESGAIVADSADFAASIIEARTAALGKVSRESMPLEIGGLTFTPGIYSSTSTISIAAGGKVTLDGNNELHPKFLFQAGTTLITGANTEFVLKNGATAENIVWALGTAATLGANSVLEGSILAGTAITFGAHAEVRGCAVAQSAVTFATAGTVGPSVPLTGDACKGF